MALGTLGQDDWVISTVLKTQLEAGMKGFFIEAGAADGGTDSNTLVLERTYGWTGLLVEPNGRFFKQLSSHRTAHCRRCVLSDRDGEIDFIEAGYFGAAPDQVRRVFETRGLSIDNHQNYKLDADQTPAKRSVLPARTLSTLLDEIDAPEVIDYFSLDVEGSEVFALNGFPWGRRRIRAITVETRFFAGDVLIDHDHRPEVRRILEAHGMVYAKDLQIDDCYVDPTLVG